MKSITKNEKMDIAIGFVVAGVVAALLLSMAGCSTADANPTSRATTATVGDVGHEIKVVFEEKSHGNTLKIDIPITIGDLAFASADSKGSTETSSPTLTPTTDIKPDIDVNYAQGGSASSGSAPVPASAAGILETLTAESVASLKSMLTSKGSGTVQLTKKDGTATTAECKDGSCTVDGVTISSADCVNCRD